jgi:hypothetical protein
MTPEILENSDFQFWQRMSLLIGNERPYPWSERVGLNRSAFQSARTRGKKPLPRTIKSWSEKIGCNYEWLDSGVAEIFSEEKKQAEKNNLIDNNSKSNFKYPSIDNVLKTTYESTEGSLKETFSVMLPNEKADFVLHLVIAIIEPINRKKYEVLFAAISTIETTLSKMQTSITLQDKVNLILKIYKIYDEYPEVLLTALKELNIAACLISSTNTSNNG